MPLDDNVKEEILKILKESSLTQEATVRNKFKEFKFSKDDVDTILESLKIKETNVDQETLYDLLTNPVFSGISYFLYESEIEGKKKIRELDFDLTFYTGGEEKEIICLTFIGEIKNTDDFRWVFTNEIESINFFPFHWVGEDFNPYARNPFVWTQQKPFPVTAYNDVVSFRTKGKNKKKEKDNYKPRVFFNQVVSGTQSKIEILKRNSSLGGFTTINIVVPLIITSTQPVVAPNLPPEISEIKEKEGILFMFRPTITPEINLWRIPILVVEQDSVLELIERLFVAILAQISQPYKRYRETKKY